MSENLAKYSPEDVEKRTLMHTENLLEPIEIEIQNYEDVSPGLSVYHPKVI